MFGEDSPTPKGVRRALLVAVAKVEGFPYLPQAHNDALRMKTFLTTCMYIVTELFVELMHYYSSCLPT